MRLACLGAVTGNSSDRGPRSTVPEAGAPDFGRAARRERQVVKSKRSDRQTRRWTRHRRRARRAESALCAQRRPTHSRQDHRRDRRRWPVPPPTRLRPLRLDPQPVLAKENNYGCWADAARSEAGSTRVLCSGFNGGLRASLNGCVKFVIRCAESTGRFAKALLETSTCFESGCHFLRSGGRPAGRLQDPSGFLGYGPKS